MNDEQKIKVESIVFKKLIKHLQIRTDVQNIDLMNLSGFCRNCLSRWYSEISKRKNVIKGYDLLKKGETIPKI